MFQILKVLLIIKEYKIQLVYQFLYFLLIYIASEFTLADIIFTTFWNLIQHLLKKDFRHQFSFFNGFTQTPHRLNDSNSLSVTKVFCWCSLNLENFLFYIWVAVVFTTFIQVHSFLPNFSTFSNPLSHCNDNDNDNEKHFFSENNKECYEYIICK